MTSPRWGERGVVRGCCLGLVVIVGVLAAAGFVTVRALMRPDLGAGPSGTRHGGTPEAIAAALAAEVGLGLIGGSHAAAVLSERDLTVVARARNPDTSRFHDPEARIRDGRVVVSAGTSVGPFDTVTVAHTVPVLRTGADGEPHVVADVTAVEVGDLSIPDWARRAVDPRGADTLLLDGLLDASPAIAVFRASLDCVGVGSEGVRLGVHRPGAAADPRRCSG